MILDGYEICAISENVGFTDALMATPIPKKLQQLSNTGTLTGFWVIDFQDKKIFWSKELVQIYENSSEFPLTHSGWVDSFASEFQTTLKSKINQFMETSDPLVFAGLLSSPFHSSKWLLMLGYNLKNSCSLLHHAIGFVSDITPQSNK
jgi:hypothetical protein